MAGNIRRSGKKSWIVSFGERGSENALYESFDNFKDAKKFYDANQDWVGSKQTGRPWGPKVKGVPETLLNKATKKLTENKFKTYSALEGKEHNSLRQLIRLEARRRKAGKSEGRGSGPKASYGQGRGAEFVDEATKIVTDGKFKKYSKLQGLKGKKYDNLRANIIGMSLRMKEGSGGKGSGFYERTNTLLDQSKTILDRYKNPLNMRELQEKLTGKLPTKDEEVLGSVKDTFRKLEEDPDYKNKVRPLTKEEALKTFRETLAKKKTPFLNTVRDVFVADVDAGLDDVAEAMVGTPEYNKVKGTAKEVQYLKDASYQINEFLKAISNPKSKAAKMSGFKDIPIYKLGPIIQSIADRVNEFGFERETIRELMVNIADASRRLPLGATENAMRKLRKAGLHIDEIVGRAATFQNAPGYMEAIQQISKVKNLEKRNQIDKYFSKVFNESLRGEFKNVDEYNKFARQFSKKQKIDTPLIKMGKNLNPEDFVLNFKNFSPGAQENIKQIAKEKGIVIQTKGKSLFKESGDLVGLLNRLVADGAGGGGSCDLAIVKAVRSGNAPGGVIGPDCSAQIKQVIQENPDQLIKEAAEAKVKPGESTGFRNVARQILSKIPKGGRIGAVIAGLGAVGAGTWAMMGGAKADDEMSYNSTEGKFVDNKGDPETQEGILNWIGEHPIYSGLAPIPVGMGAGLGAEAMGAKNIAKFFGSAKFFLPPAYAAEKIYQYKKGEDLGEMFTNPIDAIWAMALDNKASAGRKWDYYTKAAQKAAGYTGVTTAQVEAQRLGLKNLDPRRWKETGSALKRGALGPRSFGTGLVFPFAKGAAPATMGRAMTALRAGARFLPLGPIPLALITASQVWDKYKFNKEVGGVIDAMRARGVVNEEDAQTMSTIYKQGWLGTTAIGAKLLGSEELMFQGEMLDLDAQKKVLAGFKQHYEDREKTGKEFRADERQEDFFSWFSKGGRVGLAEGGNKPPFSMTRRGFLKWLVGSIAMGVAAVSGKGIKQAVKTATTTTAKTTPTKFIGVEGMPAWFPRAVAKIKTHGKLIEMADKDYVGGDIYEMMIPVERTYYKRPGEQRIKTELEKVTMADNPLTGEINMHWTGTDNFGDDAIREINFKPGQAGYQKFGVDDPTGAAQGVTEYKRVKVEEPEFTYTQPDQSQPYREDIEYLDIFEDGDEIVKGLEDMTGTKQMVTKDGTIIDVSAEGKGVDEAFQKKIFKDIEGEGQLIPEPEGVGVTKEGNVYGEEQFNEIIEGVIPDHLKKKAEGGIIETGNIARRPGAVPPLSGPNPQGTGIVGLFSSPKRVNVA